MYTHITNLGITMQRHVGFFWSKSQKNNSKPIKQAVAHTPRTSVAGYVENYRTLLSIQMNSYLICLSDVIK